MRTETITFLDSLDQNYIYRKKYRQQKEMKAKRAQSGNDKIKEQIEPQKKF